MTNGVHNHNASEPGRLKRAWAWASEQYNRSDSITGLRLLLGSTFLGATAGGLYGGGTGAAAGAVLNLAASALAERLLKFPAYLGAVACTTALGVYLGHDIVETTKVTEEFTVQQACGKLLPPGTGKTRIAIGYRSFSCNQ